MFLKASSRSELWNFRYLFSNAGASKIVFRRNLKGINSVIDLSLQIHVYTFCVFEKNKKMEKSCVRRKLLFLIYCASKKAEV